jgi:nitroreductase
MVLFEAIPRRHTNHKLYEDRPIPESDIALLHACCEEEGIWIFPTSEAPNEAELRRRIDELITLADAIQLTDQEYKTELGYWIGKGVFGSSLLMAKVGQLAVSYLNISKVQTKKDSELLLSAPVLVAMGSAGEDRKSQVKIGQIFERVALTAKYLGMAVQPMSQILEIPEIKDEVSKLLPMENVFPQHTFRIGYAKQEEEQTPRRPLEEVLV